MHTTTKKEVVTKIQVKVDEYTCDHCGKLLGRDCTPQIGSNVFHPEFKEVDDVPCTMINLETGNARACSFNHFEKILCDECLKELYSFFNIKEEDI